MQRARRTQISAAEKMQAKLADIQADYDFSRFTLADFTHWMERKTHRRIVVTSWPMATNLFGLWLQTDDTHFVFYRNDAIGIHRAHIILHELSHILCGHETLHVTLDNVTDYLRGLFEIDAALLRSLRTSVEEWEAETLSVLLQNAVHRKAVLSELIAPISADSEERKLHAALGWVV